MAPGPPAAKRRPKRVKPAKVTALADDWADLEDDVKSVLGTGVAIAKERVTEALAKARSQGSEPVSGVTPATETQPTEQSGVTPAAPTAKPKASEPVPMEVDAGAVTRAAGPPPMDRSWLPLCNDKGEFFSSDTGFRGAEDWIKERDIISHVDIEKLKASGSTTGVMKLHPRVLCIGRPGGARY